MLKTSRVKISNHALTRYRERIDPGADKPSIIQAVKESSPASKKASNFLNRKCAPRRNHFERFAYWIYREQDDCIVFVIHVKGGGRFTLVTAWPMKRSDFPKNISLTAAMNRNRALKYRNGKKEAFNPNHSEAGPETEERS